MPGGAPQQLPPMPSRLPLRSATLVLAFGSLSATSCREREAERPAAARAPIEVEVFRPERSAVPRSIRATGTLFGDDETTLAAEVAGRVIAIESDFGDEVRPGAVLVRLDPTPFALQRDERASALREALAQLGLDALPDGTFTVERVPSVEAARAQADNAKQRLERGRQLAERSPPLISDQDFADLRTAAEVAEGAYRTARLGAEARLAEARTLAAQVAIAERRLSDATIRAPVSDPAVDADRVYAVADRRVAVGDYVQIGQPLLRLVDADPIKLRVRVLERRIGQVRAGQRVEVRIEAFREPFEGVVSRVSPVVDEATRSFPVEILVANAERRLKPGSFATASIEVAEEEATLVPAAAVTTFAGIHKLLSIKEGTIDEVRVELGERFGDAVEVRTRLDPNRDFLLRPSGALVQGTPVVAMPPRKDS